jgi:hypothetical protein
MLHSVNGEEVEDGSSNNSGSENGNGRVDSDECDASGDRVDRSRTSAEVLQCGVFTSGACGLKEAQLGEVTKLVQKRVALQCGGGSSRACDLQIK